MCDRQKKPINKLHGKLNNTHKKARQAERDKDEIILVDENLSYGFTNRVGHLFV